METSVFGSTLKFMRTIGRLLLSIGLFEALFAAETKVKMQDLPLAVQASVKAQIRNAQLMGLTREKENGKTVYEVETKTRNGKTRDFILDSTGALLETEEEVDLESIPPAVQGAIQKRLAGGTLQKVEKLTKGSVVKYEAALTTKSGKHTEIQMSADGR